MARIITHAELIAVPDGGVIYLEDGAELTPLARERATARGLRIERGAAPVASHVGLGGGLGDPAALAAVAGGVGSAAATATAAPAPQTRRATSLRIVRSSAAATEMSSLKAAGRPEQDLTAYTLRFMSCTLFRSRES